MKKYRIVCFMRVDREDENENELLDLKEAKEEEKHLRFLQPENIYKIEEVEEN